MVMYYFSSTGQQEEFCCHGYVIDLLVKLSQKVNFTYDLHLVEDDNYGTFEMVILDMYLANLLAAFFLCLLMSSNSFHPSEDQLS